MKIPFYILGLLIRFGPQSGYDLKQIIEKQIADFAKIKLPTIYYHLEKLNDKGFVTYITDKNGNRPEKQIYSISPEGRIYFKDLFKKQLMDDTIFEFSIDGIFYFKDYITNDELINVLNSKKAKITNTLESIKIHQNKTINSMNSKEVIFCTNAIFEHHIIHLKGELQWIEYVLKGLQQ